MQSATRLYSFQSLMNWPEIFCAILSQYKLSSHKIIRLCNQYIMSYHHYQVQYIGYDNMMVENKRIISEQIRCIYISCQHIVPQLLYAWTHHIDNHVLNQNQYCSLWWEQKWCTISFPVSLINIFFWEIVEIYCW